MRVITIRRLVVFALCNILSGLSTQATGVPNSAFLVKVNIVSPPASSTTTRILSFRLEK